MLAPILPLAYAHGLCLPLQPRFGRLDDVSISSQTINTGDTILITGKIFSITEKDQHGWFGISSKPGSHGRWMITSIKPAGNTIDIPGNSQIPFSMTVKALQPGIYALSPILYELGIGPASEMLTGCNKAPLVAVWGNPICEKGLVGISKAEDHSTFCVRPDTAKALLDRGWANRIIPNSPQENQTFSNLQTNNGTNDIKLLLDIFPYRVIYGQDLRISIAEKNTVPHQVTVNNANSWSINGLSLGSCIPRPFGIAIYKGNYSIENITQGTPHNIFNPSTLCPPINSTLNYSFEPTNTEAVAHTCINATLSSCSYSEDMSDQVSIRGFWDSRGWFKTGTYTLVGGDEWGHVAIQHFVVMNPKEIELNLENIQTGSIDKKNGTVSASRTLDIDLHNFSPSNGSMNIEIDYPNDTTIYKTDTIQASSIGSDGLYRYNFTVTSKDPHEVYGDHRVEVSYDQAMAGIVATLHVPP